MKKIQRVIFLLIQHVPGQLVHFLVRQVKVPVGASPAGHQLLFHPGGGGRGEMKPKAETIFFISVFFNKFFKIHLEVVVTRPCRLAQAGCFTSFSSILGVGRALGRGEVKPEIEIVLSNLSFSISSLKTHLLIRSENQV